MARKITCINEDNVSITLEDKFTPWELQSCEGIYEMNSAVNTLVNTMTDGSTYQGSQVSQRNIVLVLRDSPYADHRINRTLLYSVFKPKTAGTFIYTENGISRAIDYYVEKVYIDAIKRARTATISLICPDPYFRDPEDIKVIMAGWDGQFEFQHEFIDQGEELGVRNNERLKEIENYNADDIGLTITLSANGTVTNPSITHVEKQESIKIGTTANQFTMVADDKVIITTHTNNKHVYLIHNGIMTRINEYLSEDSEFIQLKNGINTFGYNAGSGVDYLSVDITFRYRYLGV